MRKGRIGNYNPKNEDTKKENVVCRRRKYPGNNTSKNDDTIAENEDEKIKKEKNKKEDEYRSHKTIIKLRRKHDNKNRNVEENNQKNDKNEIQNNIESESNNIEDNDNSKEEKIKEKEKKISIVKAVNLHSEELKKQRKERIKKITQEENRKISDKEKCKFNVKLYVITLILILFVFISYLFVYYAPVFGITLSKEINIEEQGKIDVVATEANIYKIYGEELLVYSNQTINTYNADAKKTWEYKLESQFTPSIYIHNKYMVVANNSNGIVYLFDDKKEILNMKIEGTINSVFLDDKGNMGIYYSTNGHKNVIGVYNKNGKNIYNTYLSIDSLIDIKMLNNAKKLIITQLNISSFTPSIVISKVDIEKNSNVEEIVKLDNSFVYNLTIQYPNIIVVLDDKIASYDIDTGKENVIKDFDSNQLMYLTLNKDYYSCIEKENDKYYFISKRLNNTDLGRLELVNIPKLMDTNSMLSYLVYQDKVTVINKWGIDVKTVKISNTPREMLVFNNGKSAALVYTNKIYIINITL